MRALQGYHLLAMGLFLPALFLDPPFLALALSIALAVLILIEAIRVAGVPYLGDSCCPHISSLFASFWAYIPRHPLCCARLHWPEASQQM